MNGMLLTGDAKPLAVSLRNPNSMEFAEQVFRTGNFFFNF